MPHSCVPEAMSKEAALILFQGVLLVSRTFLTGAPLFLNIVAELAPQAVAADHVA